MRFIYLQRGGTFVIEDRLVERPVPIRLSGMAVSLCPQGAHTLIATLRKHAQTTRALFVDHPATAAVHIGDIWSVTGIYQHHIEYGIVFQVQTAARLSPRGPALGPWLAMHVPGLSQFAAARASQRAGPSLLRWIVTPTSSLSAAISRPMSLSQRAVARQLLLKNRLEASISQLLARWELHALAPAAVRAWGPSARTLIQDDPYHLLAFATFQPLDLALRKHGVVEMHASQRCAASVEQALLLALASGNTAVTRSFVCLAASALAEVPLWQIEHSCAQGIAAGRFILLPDDTIQLRGQHSIEDALARRLTAMAIAPARTNRLLSHLIRSPQPQPGGSGQYLVFRQASHMARCRIFITPTPRVADVLIHGRDPHLLELTGQPDWASPADERARMSVYAFLQHQRFTPLPPGTVIHLHEAQTLNNASLLQVLVVVPEDGSIVLIGRRPRSPPCGQGWPWRDLLACDRVHKTIISDPGSTTPMDRRYQAWLSGEKQVWQPYIAGCEDAGLYRLHVMSAQLCNAATGVHYQAGGPATVFILAGNSLCEQLNTAIHNALMRLEGYPDEAIIPFLPGEPVFDHGLLFPDIPDFVRGQVQRPDVPRGAANAALQASVVIRFEGISHRVDASAFHTLRLGHAVSWEHSGHCQIATVIMIINKEIPVAEMSALLHRACELAHLRIILITDIPSGDFPDIPIGTDMQCRTTGLVARLDCRVPVERQRSEP